MASWESEVRSLRSSVEWTLPTSDVWTEEVTSVDGFAEITIPGESGRRHHLVLTSVLTLPAYRTNPGHWQMRNVRIRILEGGQDRFRPWKTHAGVRLGPGGFLTYSPEYGAVSPMQLVGRVYDPGAAVTVRVEPLTDGPEYTLRIEGFVGGGDKYDPSK
jgi:hypothetical protein